MLCIFRTRNQRTNKCKNPSSSYDRFALSLSIATCWYYFDSPRICWFRMWQRKWAKQLQSPVLRKGLQKWPLTEVATLIMDVLKHLLMLLGNMVSNFRPWM